VLPTYYSRLCSRTASTGCAPFDAYEVPPAPVWPMYMMLAGLALENLLKGIQIARDPRLVLPSPSKRTALLASTLTRHLDLNLVRDAGVRLSPEEADLVERLSVFVVWGGRYPVPKDALAMKSVPAPDGSTRGPATSTPPR